MALNQPTNPISHHKFTLNSKNISASGFESFHSYIYNDTALNQQIYKLLHLTNNSLKNISAHLTNKLIKKYICTMIWHLTNKRF